MAIAIEPPVLTADNIERTVRELLAGHDLFHVPVNPVAVAQALGLSVFDADFGGEAVSGMLRKTRDRHEILVNSCHSPTRKRFIIAHELGHYVLHKDKMDPFIDPDVNLFRSIQADRQKSADRTIEAQANMFSARC